MCVCACVRVCGAHVYVYLIMAATCTAYGVGSCDFHGQQLHASKCMQGEMSRVER